VQVLTKTFSVVQVALEEVITTQDYCFDNAGRVEEEGESLVIQRTLAGEVFFEDATGRHLVPPGHAMIFTHSDPSRYGYVPESREAYRHQFIAFSPAPVVNGLFDRLRQDYGSIIRLPEDSEAVVVFLDILDRFAKRSFRDRYQETELLVRLLVAVYRDQVRCSEATDPIEFGYHYLNNRFRRPINLKSVVDKCGISREHFIREFTKRYQASPGVFLRNMRLEHANRLLKATSLPVEEIAVASGFSSSDTFSRAYRREYGCSPGSIRETTSIGAR